MKLRSLLLLVTASMLCASAIAEEARHPVLMTTDDLAGGIFDREDTLRTPAQDGSVTLDVTSLMSSDSRFASGMYRSGKERYDITEPYGVDEFMFFLEGSVTLTSTDGTVTRVKAGEAITVPKEWTGVWETDGYRKIWVIYSNDGSAFE
ncbi:MAG: DUF861 domain-containing protein [Gammaproteobacteria bacterium]|nr:MAG: DUF861 domain-containing protein [Gammaproteobacteria bacterium]